MENSLCTIEGYPALHGQAISKGGLHGYPLVAAKAAALKYPKLFHPFGGGLYAFRRQSESS
jgi:hypothetical protein